MCRIMGYVGAPFDEEELRHFYTVIGNIHRDAAGVALVGKAGTWVCKSGVPGPSFWDKWGSKVLAYQESSNIGLFHVRMATHGEPDNNDNNHPLVGNSAVLVHNGIVVPPKWLDGKGVCDSEQLLLYWEKEGPESWSRFRGSASVLLYEKGRLFCYSNSNSIPLYWRQVRGGVQVVQLPKSAGWQRVPLDRVCLVTSEGPAPLASSREPVHSMSRQLPLPVYGGVSRQNQPHAHSQWIPAGSYKVGAMSMSGGRLKADRSIYLDPCYLQPGSIWAGYRSKLSKTPSIYVHWPGGSRISIEELSRLVRYVTHCLYRGESVAIGCTNGHGRTGALLAALLVRIESLSGVTALRQIRSRYCSVAAAGYEELVLEYAYRQYWAVEI